MKHILTQDEIDCLKCFCDDNEIELRLDYSGRGMYGKKCIGFVTSEQPFYVAMRLMNFLCLDTSPEDDFDELIDAFQDNSPREDSMGLDRIIYFPEIICE